MMNDKYGRNGNKRQKEFIQELEVAAKNKNYPECDPDLIYQLVNAEFMRDQAFDENDTQFAYQIQEQIDEVMAPVENVLSHEEEYSSDVSKEEVALADTIQPFNETIGSFSEQSGRLVHGGDIANEFITADDKIQAKRSLKKFADWYQDDLDSMLNDKDQKNQKIEGIHSEYDIDEFENIALFNGLRTLFYHRERGEEIGKNQMQTP